MEQALECALNALLILAGEKAWHSDVSWQDIAGTAMVNLNHLAKLIENARVGYCEPAITFPSPTEILDRLNGVSSHE